MQPMFLRLEIDGLRDQIVHAFALHGKQVELELRVELAKVLESFDWQTEVAKLGRQILQEQLKLALQQCITAAMYDARVRKELYNAVIKDLEDRHERIDISDNGPAAN